MSDIIIHNGIKRPEKLKLSIVTPVYKNDPSALFDALRQELHGSNYSEKCEIVIVDDGSNIQELSDKLQAEVQALEVPTTLITFGQNKGRSKARNALIENSIGEYLLFLDSDMLPDSKDFIAKWLLYIATQSPEITYGGYSILQASTDPKYALARALSENIDCMGHEERQKRGALAVATSNLLVRRDIMEKVPFDNGFSGWGWEDVDWALRANSANYKVNHAPIPATHLGLDEDKILLEKFQKAGPNFKTITERHPEMLELSSTKIALILAKVPLLGLFAPIIYWLACAKFMPLSLRSKAARIWRAIWAAMSLKG